MTATRIEGCWEAVQNNYEEIVEKSQDSTVVLSDDKEKNLRKNKNAVTYLNAFEINAYLKKSFYKQTMDEMVRIEHRMAGLTMKEKDDPSNIAEEVERLNNH